MFLVALCLFAVTGALILSALLTWCVRAVATRKSWARGPESERHVHSRPIPRLGGVAVYLTFTLIILFETAIVNFGLHQHSPGSTRLLLHILMPATLMFLTGLADDFRGVRPIVKLCLQLVAGAWLWELGCRVGIGVMKLHGVDYSTALSCTATILWVVMLSNAFNLIDGLDGLAAGSSVFPLLTFSAAAVFHHNGQMSVASLILTGALLGFLRFNFNPATIFLGDCGSLFLGFMLSALSLSGDQEKAPTLLSVALPMVACGLPIAETLVSVLRRFLSGRPIFGADREHFHHRLLNLGFTHRQVVVLLFGVSGVCSLISVVLLFPKPNVLIVVGIVLLLLATVAIGQLGYPEFEEIGRVLARVRDQKLVIAQNVKVRQIATGLKYASDWDYVSDVLQTGFEEGDFSNFKLRIYERDEAPYRSKRLLVFSRAVSLRSDRSDTQWTLNLEFAAADLLGELELQCPYRHQSLKIDVNVLLQVLNPALCRVCRNVAGAERYLPIPEQAIVKSAAAAD
jgi:UDP-GlcNAc:undecaprenyl-phosphate/decaprenyl-phosphate GlcNAc-1-phosphate transferase